MQIKVYTNDLFILLYHTFEYYTTYIHLLNIHKQTDFENTNQ